MILNPNKTKALVVSRSRTVSPPYGDLILSGVSIRASPNLDILSVKFDSSSPSKTMCVVLFPMSLRELVFWVWWNVYLWTPLCYVVAILNLFSLSIVLLCGGQVLNVTFSFLSGRCIRWPGFVSIIVFCCHRRRELGLVCCSMLIRTVIAVQRACICVYYRSTIFELRPQLIHWSLKYQGVESPNLPGLSCRPRFECGMTVPTPNGAVNRLLLPWVVFSLVFRGASACWVAKAFYGELCFSHLGLCC